MRRKGWVTVRVRIRVGGSVRLTLTPTLNIILASRQIEFQNCEVTPTYMILYLRYTQAGNLLGHSCRFHTESWFEFCAIKNFVKFDLFLDLHVSEIKRNATIGFQLSYIDLIYC